MLNRFPRLKSVVDRYGNVLFFVGGFLVDVFTLQRIDSKLDLIWQGSYLVLITGLILLETREDWGLWHPHRWIVGLWKHNVEALHFFYGGLLSNYCIYYFKSTTVSRSGIFLVLVIVLMFANEMPQVKRVGHFLRLGLYAFCVASYLNFFIPILAGRISTFIFALALFLSALITAGLVWVLGHWRVQTQSSGAPLREQQIHACIRLGAAPIGVLGIIGILYALKWIPPVPLSMQYGGVYHAIEKSGDRYQLSYVKPPWYTFWRQDDRVFLARPGDTLHCFFRVFAPTRFSHQLTLEWLRRDPRSQRLQTQDRIPIEIVGGRDHGFRGVAIKSNYEPGIWRVDVESSDGRMIGSIPFEVRPDDSQDPRSWRTREM